jgi:hypothetical protein
MASSKESKDGKESKNKKDKYSQPSVSVVQFIIVSILFQFFLSYVITESWTWGYKSKWMYPQNWKQLYVPRHMFQSHKDRNGLLV